MSAHCALCGTADLRVERGGLRDDPARCVARCGECGLLQVTPRPTAEEDRAFYDANAQDLARGKKVDRDGLREAAAFDTERHVRLVESLGVPRGARVLDVGAGYGFFVNALAEAGFEDVTGFEISRDRRALAAEWGSAPVLDMDVRASDIGEHARAYDVVTLFHVLEHTADPAGFLRSLAHFVAPGGTLVVEVPNADELMLETCPAYEAFHWIRAHLLYFTAETLGRCIAVAGLPEPAIRFEQRYGLLNLANWLLRGEPQIERPTFEIDGAYREVENGYRAWLAERGRTDALIALVRIP